MPSRQGWQKAHPQERKKASRSPSMAGSGRRQAVQCGRVGRVLNPWWAAGEVEGVPVEAAGAGADDVGGRVGGLGYGEKAVIQVRRVGGAVGAGGR